MRREDPSDESDVSGPGVDRGWRQPMRDKEENQNSEDWGQRRRRHIIPM